MKLLNFIKLMVMLTVISLIYINLQMQIFDLAYQGRVKEKHIRELNDDHGRITYSILSLQSSNHLGVKLLQQESGLKFVDNDNIVKLVTKEILPQKDKLAISRSSQKKTNFLLSFLTLRSQAEARQLERK